MPLLNRAAGGAGGEKGGTAWDASARRSPGRVTRRQRRAGVGGGREGRVAVDGRVSGGGRPAVAPRRKAVQGADDAEYTDGPPRRVRAGGGAERRGSTTAIVSLFLPRHPTRTCQGTTPGELNYEEPAAPHPSVRPPGEASSHGGACGSRPPSGSHRLISGILYIAANGWRRELGDRLGRAP